MPRRSKNGGFAWLEVLLAISILVLVLQILPIKWLYFWNRITWETNLSNWSSGRWFTLNAFLLAIFFGIRYWPEAIASWQEHKENALLKRKDLESHKEAESKKKERLEQRKRIEQIKQSRHRRIY